MRAQSMEDTSRYLQCMQEVRDISSSIKRLLLRAKYHKLLDATSTPHSGYANRSDRECDLGRSSYRRHDSVPLKVLGLGDPQIRHGAPGKKMLTGSCQQSHPAL